MAQLRRLGFQVDLGLLDRALVALLLGLCLALAQQPQQMLLLFAVGMQGLETLRDLGLAFELVEVGAELAQDVFHAGQVLARVRQAVFRLAAAFLVLGHAAASSRKIRMSSGLASIIREIMPWPMMA